MLAKFRNLAFSLGILLLILACSSPAPTATPYLPPEPTTLPTQGPVTSVAPTPVPTPEPALTATSSPTAMPASTAAPLPTPTPAPLPTATAAPLPTPTPTPAPPPTATPPPPPTPTPTPAERDRAILTAFYHAMDGPNWANSTNWLTDSPLSEWYGVSLGRNSGVVWLLLPSNRLKGEIPAELGDLPALENLDLSRNLLLGCIPLTLVYHKYLYEYGSPNFGGILKPCENPDRAALVSLYHATGGPDWAESENWLTDAPLGDWHGVQVNEWGRVTSLGFPVSGEIPVALLADLPELEWLNLGWSQSTGEIPPELGNLVNLKVLLLNSNQLTGEIPPELGNLVNLEGLDLSNNQLTGAIPRELGNLVNLRELNLSDNQLTGAIPPELGNLGSLSLYGSRLLLSNNQLTGAIPPELGNLSSLNLADNQLTGVIPPELVSLDNLRELWLANNKLTGVIPPELVYLGTVSLSGNRFSGCVPRPLEQIGVDPAELGLEWCP